jgi:hypothetical protein
MLVKSREEPKSVLAWEILAASSCSVWHREASCLASEHVFLFAYGDIVSALRQFMRGAQSRDSTAEYGYTLGHGDRVPPEKQSKPIG